MSDENWPFYVVCNSDLCDPHGFAERENAETYRKQHMTVNPHRAYVRPASEVNV